MAIERNDIHRIAALLRLSYADELSDDVRDAIREHCAALRDICDAQVSAIAYARAEGARAAIAQLKRVRKQCPRCSAANMTCISDAMDAIEYASRAERKAGKVDG